MGYVLAVYLAYPV